MNKVLLGIFVLLFTLSGCAVLDSETAKVAWPKLSRWKLQADEAVGRVDEKKYREARFYVNGWIEGKKTEITIAGGQVFTTVELDISEEIDKKVAAVFQGRAVVASDWVSTLTFPAGLRASPNQDSC